MLTRRQNLKHLLALSAAAATPLWLSAGQSCAPEPDQWGNRFQNCDANIPSSQFKHVRSVQRGMVWCWAATLEMIFRWHGKMISQEDIVLQTFGRLVDAPADPLTLLNAVSRSYRTRQGGFHVHSKVWAPDFGIDQLNNLDLISALRANRPMVVCNASHMMVLIGVNYLQAPNGAIQVRQAWVADPFLMGSVTEHMGSARLPAGFRYLYPAELQPITMGGQLRFVADVRV
jgi:hypothetical protein